ncbi:MAG: metallophosphoesterase [Clostridia bacterium]|nr:metallophosphoesterase [Clostridia bacterium]
MAIAKLIISFFLSIGQILSPVVAFVANGGEGAFFTEWSETDTFDKDDYIELKKTPGEDFVVLNLTDVQLNDEEIYDKEGIYTETLIRKLVEEQKPDLITLSGDNAWATMAYIELIKLIDSFGIPWAPVMGNHDGQRCISEFWAAYLLSQAENCLFRFGPKDMGYGNYIINVTENDHIIHTFFMFDTHANDDFVKEDGSTVSGYDHIWDNQKAWYKWAVEGIAAMEGKTVESTAVMHIPVVEYENAWQSVKMDSEGAEFGVIDPQYSEIASGRRREAVCSSPVNNAFFTLCKDLGSTKNILVGHDHVNDYSVYYDGIRLTYSVKTGFGSYWDGDMIGGTTLSLNSLGNIFVESHYVDLEANGFDITDE